tara:strand:+ start:144 stop:452 length:309 start_codon:yes stop_codon:yes gene_type:complete
MPSENETVDTTVPKTVSNSETTTSETPSTQTVNVDQLTLVQCLNLIWSLLNQATTKGAFNIDEAYAAKVVFQRLTSFVQAPPTTQSTTETTTETTEESNVDV